MEYFWEMERFERGYVVNLVPCFRWFIISVDIDLGCEKVVLWRILSFVSSRVHVSLMSRAGCESDS